MVCSGGPRDTVIIPMCFVTAVICKCLRSVHNIYIGKVRGNAKWNKNKKTGCKYFDLILVTGPYSLLLLPASPASFVWDYLILFCSGYTRIVIYDVILSISFIRYAIQLHC